MKKGLCLLGALILTVMGMALALRLFYYQSTPVIRPVTMTGAQTLILDAGHGGEDGGALSVTGVAESGINLSIVRKMNDILAFYGAAPTLLRTTDISLHSAGAETLREKKVSDLKNRTATVTGMEGATLISIHQNTYPSQRYHGAQVFFSLTSGSQELAEHMQERIKSSLQPENNRASKQIADSIYLLNHIPNRAVLIECGFLSNPEEEALLRDDAYQRKLAAVICQGWLTFVAGS